MQREMRYHGAAKKMPLVSGMISRDSRSTLGFEKMTNVDKADALVKQVVRAPSPAVIQPRVLGALPMLTVLVCRDSGTQVERRVFL